MKYITAAVIFIVLIFSQTQAQEFVPIDAIVIIDVSWSMADADPNRLANYATNMFINKLNPEADRIGLVAYAGSVTFYHELTVLTEENISYLHSRVNGLAYASWTDHAPGIFKAIQLLEDLHTPDRQPIIIFLTDGNLSLNPRGTRTHEEGEHDLYLATELAKQLGFPIFSIGLNHDGTLDRSLVQNIANETGGLAFETYTAEDLPEIMAAIFAEMMVLHLPVYYVEEPEPIPIVEEFLPEPATEYTEDYYPEEEPERNPWMLVISAVLFAIGVTFIIVGKKKRIFTGKLVIESDSLPPIYRNLIEYGNSTTLAALLKKELPAEFEGIAIFPCPKAPSHMPQLVLRCKNPNLKFKKNFLDEEAPVSLSNGTLIVITNTKTETVLRIKYIVA